jgi:hypothetical protein
MDIWTRPSNTGPWTRPEPALREAYVNYKEREHYYRECPFITGDYIVYRPENDPYLPTYVARVDDITHTATAATRATAATTDEANDSDEASGASGPGTHLTVRQGVHERLVTAMPIIDMNDVCAFIISNAVGSRSNWMPCRDYQAWAYRDFIYDPHRSIKKSYMSPYSSYLVFNRSTLVNQIVTIELDNLPPNIVFNVSRNENNSVYFERNDAQGSRVRMCDNAYARAGYLGYYTRMTMDVGMVVILPPSSPPPHSTPTLSTHHLSDQQETGDESNQCILCNTYAINVKFSPCEHATCCSGCYSKLSKNECPVCRAHILRLLTP